MNDAVIMNEIDAVAAELAIALTEFEGDLLNAKQAGIDTSDIERQFGELKQSL